MKKVLSILIIGCLLTLTGCDKQEYQMYSKNFFGAFDTLTQYITYAKSEEEFNEQCEYIEEQLNYYDHLFDKYNSYENVNNVRTINQQAGKEAVEVDQPLIDLIKLSIERNKSISDKVNIAFGNVINIWHNYREEAEENGGIGTIPTMEELKKANQHTDLNSVVIDEEHKTVFIKDKNVSLDVGATAKGYAIELIKQGLIDMGVDNFLLSGGGNVTSHGKRKIQKDTVSLLEDCRDYFCVGLESPQDGNFAQKEDEASESEALLVANGKSIVTSGDYQRFYKDINGVRYHHLIDPDTLYPAVHFRSVSIITEDSGLADFLSSAVFLMTYEDGLKLVNSLEGVEAIWLLEDGKIRMSNGLKDNEGLYIIEKDRLK